MCTNLKYIERSVEHPLRDASLQRYMYRNPSELWIHYSLKKQPVIIPCGKCLECLKRRQNDLAVRCMREASKTGSMHFLTLTYDNDSLPLSCFVEQIDKDSGEIVARSAMAPLLRPEDGFKERSDSSPFPNILRTGLCNIAASPHARYFSAPWYEDESYLVRFVVTPTLYRRDVRLWIKSCRVQYKRDTGFDLPKHKFVCCGEMGPRTCRPHYHICFFGLTDEQVYYFASRWKYGFTNYKKVNMFNQDGTNGFELAARYIGKYMSKGVFECDAVKSGDAQKPRLMLSKFVGNELDESLLSYYRCYDQFGKYDIMTLKGEDGKDLSPKIILRIAKLSADRMTITCGSCKYALPRSLILKIWYFYDSLSQSLRASPLRKAISLVTFPNALQRYQDQQKNKLQSFCGQVSRYDFDSYSESVFSDEDNSVLPTASEAASLCRFYRSSNF